MRRYIRTEQAPIMGPGAFSPLPAMIPSASSGGVVRTEGYPGNLAVAAGPPGVVNVGMDPLTNPSACAPNMIFPDIYIAHADNMAPPVPISLTTNVMPVPAPDPVRVPRQSTHKARLGGRTATSWPRKLVKWPTIGGGSA